MWAIENVSTAALANIKESQPGKQGSLFIKQNYTIEKLPDKLLLQIFGCLPHSEIGRLARVCRRWRTLSADPRLWTTVSLRAEISGLHVASMDTLLQLISLRFGTTLRYLEMPIDLITHTVLHELAAKCPNLASLLLDFSSAMQLHDFADLHSFPTKLRTLILYLSEVIFMEGFIRKISGFINGLEVLHLVGTYEKAVDDEQEEIFEVVNVHKLKQFVPNLRVINLYGVNFVDDSHIESFSSNCMQLECLSVNYCIKVTGTTLKVLFQRCKRLKCLFMQHTSLQSEHVMSVDWQSTSLVELDISATDLSAEALTDLLTRLPALRYLAAGQQDFFGDAVLSAMMDKGTHKSLVAIDLDRNEALSEDVLLRFLRSVGPQLRGLGLSGIPCLMEHFWMSAIPLIPNLRILVMGMPEGCCQKITQKIHIDGLMDAIATHCTGVQRIEARWDTETLRFSDRSSKATDAIRLKCLQLRALVLSDGKYFEIVKSSFERADRATVVRSTSNCRVTLVYLCTFYRDLIFN